MTFKEPAEGGSQHRSAKQSTRNTQASQSAKGAKTPRSERSRMREEERKQQEELVTLSAAEQREKITKELQEGNMVMVQSKYCQPSVLLGGCMCVLELCPPVHRCSTSGRRLWSRILLPAR